MSVNGASVLMNERFWWQSEGKAIGERNTLANLSLMVLKENYLMVMILAD